MAKAKIALDSEFRTPVLEMYKDDHLDDGGINTIIQLCVNTYYQFRCGHQEAVSLTLSLLYYRRHGDQLC